MRWMWALTFVAVAAPHVAAQSPAPSPAAAMGRMTGGCDSYSWDMTREMEAWDRPALAWPSAADASSASSPVPLDRKLDVTLHPLAATRLAAPPERKPQGGHAGLLVVSVPTDGVYRIAAGSRVWIDVVDGTQPVASAKFEGRSGCAKVHKVVAFPLKAGREYRAQISGSETAAVSVLVTADR